MKPTGKIRHHERSRDSGTGTGQPPCEASLGIAPEEIDPDAWAELVRRARDRDVEAYRNLWLRLGGFRHCFAGHIFADPEGAYREFVRELVDRIRFGFLRDPHSLLAQARNMAMRKAADRIRCLTTAARILGSLPKRHREVLIRAELALGPSAQAGRNGDGAPVRRTRATASP
jgi:hypothetical protein